MGQYVDSDGVSDVGRAYVVSAPAIKVITENGVESIPTSTEVNDLQTSLTDLIDERLSAAQRAAIDALTPSSTAADIVAALQA